MHLNDVLATIGIEQLKWLDRLVSKQRKGAIALNLFKVIFFIIYGEV